MKSLIYVFIVLGLLLAVNLAFGQSYTIIQPGRAPSFYTPNYGGGGTLLTPGQAPTFITPNYGGGATAITPGQQPIFITPSNPQPMVNPYQQRRIRY